MRKFIILALLMVFCGLGFGADRYIDWDSGNDTTGDGTIGNPWKSFEKAYNSSTDGETVYVVANDDPSGSPYEKPGGYTQMFGVRSLTFEGLSSNAEDVVFKGTAGQSYHIRFEGSAAAPRSLTFRNMTLRGNTTNPAMLRNSSSRAYASDITLDNVICDGPGSIITASATNGSTSEPTYTFSNLTSTANNGIILIDAAAVNLNNVDITTVTNGHGLKLSGDVGTVIIDDYTFDTGIASGGSAILGDSLTSLEYLIGRNLTFTVNGSAGTGGSGIRIEDFAQNVLIDNITVINNATTGNVAGIGIQLGKDLPTNANPLGFVSVANATITYTGDVTQHGVLAGAGCDYGRYENITVDTKKIVSAVGIGIVVKGDGNYWSGVVSRSQRPLLIKGGSRSKFTDLTLYAYYLTDDQAANATVSIRTDVTEIPSNNIIENSIIFAEAGVDVLIYDGDGTDHDNMFDYNCYYGGDNIAWLDGGAIADIAALRTKWGTYSVLGSKNDTNSIEEDPSLDANNKPRNPNVINGGRPDINGNSTSIGAIQAGTETTTEISIMGPTVINVLGPN